MNNKYLVEECFCLTPKDVTRNLTQRPDVNYWFDDIDGGTFLFISVAGHEPQKIAWELSIVEFGERAYFYCPCGHRAAKLYLPPNSHEFKCRKCHSLRYEISLINRSSMAGDSIYHMKRMQKLADIRLNMSRIFYNGKYTKRFERFLRMCSRAGLDDVVRDANALRELLKQ